jgi:protein-disulfide isomerase
MRVGNLALNAATVVASVVLVVVIWDRFQSRTATKPTSVRAERVESPSDYAGGEIRVGDGASAVRVVEFSDFACPYCARAAATIRRLLADSMYSVSFEYRHVLGHANSARLASAAICAFRAGRFMTMHDYLFRHPEDTSSARLASAAASLGIAPAAGFERCMNSDSTARSIERDTIAARRLGISGTPTILINNQLYEADPGYDALKSQLKDTVR